MKKIKSEPKDVSSDLEKFISDSENEKYHTKKDILIFIPQLSGVTR